MAANNHRILIRNGRIFDPAQGIDRIGDLSMFKNRIVDTLPGDGSNLMVIDADGDLVVPGLIDFHAHLGFGSSELGFDPDLICLPNGVTSVVDAGTRGISSIHQMATEIVPAARTNIKCLLNVSPTGIVSSKYPECIDPRHFDLEQVRYCFEKYPKVLIGLKLRLMPSTLTDFTQTGLAPLTGALELAERLGVRLAVHVTDPPCPYRDIVDQLRPGDILVHPYQGMGQTILDGRGEVDPCLKAAQARGVLLDLAGARLNQSYAVARQAIAAGLAPNIFSTDLTRDSVFMKPVFSLPYILSTYLNLGVPLADLIRGCTATPARLMNQAGEIGTLATGAIADVCILKQRRLRLEFADWFGNAFTGDTLLEPRATIREGRLVHLAMDVRQEFIRTGPLA